MRVAAIPIAFLALSLIALMVFAVDLFVPTVELHEVIREVNHDHRVAAYADRFTALAGEVTRETHRVSVGLVVVFCVQLVAVLWLIWLTKIAFEMETRPGWRPREPSMRE